MASATIPQDHVGFGYQVPGENAEDRDNQQERLLEIVWLAAMLEGEGTFTFQYNEQYQDGAMKCHIQPRVIFVNTDLKLTSRVEQIFINMGVKPYRKDKIICGIGEKPKSEVQINGFKALSVLKTLFPYIYGSKKEVVACLIEFIEYRQNNENMRQVYGDYEYDLVKKVREINSGHWKRKPKFSTISSETVRQRREAAWAVADAKIQSGLHGDMQNATEMIASTSNRKESRRRNVYPDYGRK